MTQTQFHASKKEFKKEVCMCGGWGGGGGSCSRCTIAWEVETEQGLDMQTKDREN